MSCRPTFDLSLSARFLKKGSSILDLAVNRWSCPKAPKSALSRPSHSRWSLHMPLLFQSPTEILTSIRQHLLRSCQTKFPCNSCLYSPMSLRACQLASNTNMKSRKLPTRPLLTQGSMPETFKVVWYAAGGRQEDNVQA
jgi:hypothetical protein